MKATFITLALMAGVTVASAAVTAHTSLTGGDITANSGSTFGSLTLKTDMTTGNPSSFDALNFLSDTVNITGGNFFASDYTISLWLTTAQLSTDKVLFIYSGSTASNDYGYNGYTWNAESKTITVGRGNYTAGNHSISYQDRQDSNALTISDTDELVNLTFAVSGSNGSQVVTIWQNGEEIQTLSSYNGNMNNGNEKTKMILSFDTNTTYGDIAITNEKLTTAEQIASLAVVPEPTTATLSMLALGALALRRRRA